jgi:hypothetical protein
VSEAGSDWSAYLSGVAAFAGTLFALVLAARQIRGRLLEDPHPSALRAKFVDSIAVTVELGAAAALALLYEIRLSVLFSFAVAIVAIFGLSLSAASATAYAEAIHRGAYTDSPKGDRRNAGLQALGNLLPAACYVVALLYAFRIVQFGEDRDWGFAAAVSWLTFSGIVQSILWYTRIWDREKRPTSVSPGA